MLYEDSPGYLNQIFSELFVEDISNVIGVSFNQQVKKGDSVPDGLITQRALSIYIEVKNHDWFYDSQLEKHLDGLINEKSGIKVLMLLGNIEADLEPRFREIREKNKKRYDGEIFFSVVTFEAFLAALNSLMLPKRLQYSVAELEHFFDEQNLLPRWKGMLNVVNCSGSIENVLEHGVYTCPTTGGAYSHKRCLYFGAYGGKKRVEFVCQIRAVLEYEDGNNGRVSWKNTNENGKKLIAEGTEKLQVLGQVSGSVRVFLLGDRFPTNFMKDTKGGMQQSKVYFDVAELRVKNAAGLAGLLKDRNWSSLK